MKPVEFHIIATFIGVALLASTPDALHAAGNSLRQVSPPTPISWSHGGDISTNATKIYFDYGPREAQSARVNIPFVDVTICAPLSHRCQTVDHIILDTGSVGLRIQQDAISPSLLAGLPMQSDDQGRHIAECYVFADGYVFGSIRSIDLKIGGDTVRNLPVQVIGDMPIRENVPISCASPNGRSRIGIEASGAKGVLGVGLQVSDCGAVCETGQSAGATYYACGQVVCEATSQKISGAPNTQIANPITRMKTHNNGIIISIPSATAMQAPLEGILRFGINTAKNNKLKAGTVIHTERSGFFTLSYGNHSFSRALLDSGNNYLALPYAEVPKCEGQTIGYYCPNEAVELPLRLLDSQGRTGQATATIGNASDLFKSGAVVLPGLAGDPGTFTHIDPSGARASLGLPFFLGKTIYLGYPEQNAGPLNGPFFAY